MKKTILFYGILLAVLTGILKFLEYQFLVRSFSIEVYIGMVAIFFTALGAWAGLKLTRRKTEDESLYFKPSTPTNFEVILEQLGISKREYEVLQLMAKGHSNQEIADQLFVSLNTVKTHSSNLFMKLNARRRTQAVQKAKLLGLLPL